MLGVTIHQRLGHRLWHPLGFRQSGEAVIRILMNCDEVKALGIDHPQRFYLRRMLE